MTIVVGYTPTEDGGAALVAAVAEARRRGGELVVVNTTVHDDFAAETYADEKQVDAVRAGIEEQGVTVTFRQSSDDEPAEALLRAAEELSAELVVIGVHRRSRVAKLILGSTAQRVVLEAPCPVLTVKPKS